MINSHLINDNLYTENHLSLYQKELNLLRFATEWLTKPTHQRHPLSDFNTPNPTQFPQTQPLAIRPPLSNNQTFQTKPFPLQPNHLSYNHNLVNFTHSDSLLNPRLNHLPSFNHHFSKAKPKPLLSLTFPSRSPYQSNFSSHLPMQSLAPSKAPAKSLLFAPPKSNQDYRNINIKEKNHSSHPYQKQKFTNFLDTHPRFTSNPSLTHLNFTPTSSTDDPRYNPHFPSKAHFEFFGNTSKTQYYHLKTTCKRC